MVHKISLACALFCLTLTLSAVKVHGQIPSPRSYLFVEIRDTSGQPVTDASVTVYGTDRKQISNRVAKTESRTLIEFPIRSDHHYNVLVSKQGYQPSEHVFFPKPSSHGVTLIDKLPIGYVVESSNIVLRKPPATESERKAFAAQELQTQLILAAKRGDSFRISKLLQMGVAADTVDANGTSALLWALFAGDSDTINILLEGGAHVRTANPLSSKALLIFFVEGIPRDQKRVTSNANETGDEIYKRESAVFKLIKAGADVNAKDPYLGTTLNAALRAVPDSLRAIAVEELIRSGANVNTLDEAQGATPLMWASQSGSLETVKTLLAAGASIDVRDRYGRTPLMWAQGAARYPGRFNPETLKVLINAGANVNAIDGDGTTVLMIAAQADSTDAIKILLAAGAQVNAKNKWGYSPLITAFDSYYYLQSYNKDSKQHPTPQTIKTLLTAGADIHAAHSDGKTLVMLAARTDSLEALKMLLEAGAQINARDKKGQTVLMYDSLSSYTPSVEAFKILIDAKADPNAVSSDGRTPLMFAAYGAPNEIFDLLLERGAKTSINARDYFGQTALLHACAGGFTFRPDDQVRTVKALIDAGADVSIKDNSGRTVLEVAQTFTRNEALIELLKSKLRN